MNIYPFDDLQEGRKAVKMAMAEAGCFGPKIEEQMAGQSPNKDMISSFINWKQKVCTFKLMACVTKGLGAWMADVLEAGDTMMAEKPSIRKVFEPVNWMNDDATFGLLKKYGTDDLDEIIHRIYDASESKEELQECIDLDLQDLNIDMDVVRRSEQVQHFAVQFIPKVSS